MTLTAYDRRQLRKARAWLIEAQFQVELALTDGRYYAGGTACRCGLAANRASLAEELLDRTDVRLTRRARHGHPRSDQATT